MFGPNRRFIKIISLFFLCLFMYFLARLEFVIWNWAQFKDLPFSHILVAFFAGARFDATSTSMLIAPVVLISLIPWGQRFEGLWKVTIFVFFMATQVPLFILNLGDTELINFVGRRFTLDTMFLLSEIPGKASAFLMTYWHLMILNSLLVLVFFYWAYKIIFKTYSQDQWKFYSPILTKRYYRRFAAAAFFMVFGVAIGVRGGFQSRPLTFVMANIFDEAILNNSILNSSFTFLKSFTVSTIEKVVYFEDRQQMLSQMDGNYKGSVLEGTRPQTPQNVVIIILESFGEEYIGPNETGHSFTPFIDSLKSKSLSFKNAYANGRRSIEGVIAALSGVPSLMDKPFVSSQYTGNKLVALGTAVKELGYSTSFFHGGDNGTMHFDSFTPWAGFEKYYGFKEYPNPKDHDGHWGVWDGIFLPWMAGELTKQKAPFLSAVFTLSSHHPFKIPDQYKDRFNKGSMPMLNAVEYSDFAVQKFFEEAEKQPWFKDTLFVITADHTSLHYRPAYQNDQGNYRIPLIFYHPQYQFPVVNTDMVVEQIDIMPSVMDFLGIVPKEKNYLTSSVFVPGDKVGFVFISGRYILFSKDYVLTWMKGGEEFKLFAANDWKMQNELNDPEHAVIKEGLITKLKAHRQYFNEGLWENKLLYPNGDLAIQTPEAPAEPAKK